MRGPRDEEAAYLGRRVRVPGIGAGRYRPLSAWIPNDAVMQEGDSGLRLGEWATRRTSGAFGPPKTVNVGGGNLYRWVFLRPISLSLNVTLHARAIPHIALVLISDPCSTALPIVVVPIQAVLRIGAVVERIRNEWGPERPGPIESPTGCVTA